MKDKIKYWIIRIFKGKDKAFDFRFSIATDMQMKNMYNNNKKKSNLYADVIVDEETGQRTVSIERD